MIAFDVSDLTRYFVSASVPGHLYRKLYQSRSVQFLSHSRTAEELFEALREGVSAEAPTREEVVRTYAVLVALLMKPEAQHFPIGELPVSTYVEWVPDFVRAHLSRSVNTSRTPTSRATLAQNRLVAPDLGRSTAITTQSHSPLIIPRTIVTSKG